MLLWSRDLTLLRKLNRRGSDMSSTQIVVNTTIFSCQDPGTTTKFQNSLVVPNCVFNRFPCIPCRPRLALMNVRATKVNTFVHAGSPLLFAMLGWPLFHRATAAAIVNKACNKVPATCQMRFEDPTRSPMRPTNAPRLKAMREQRAC